MTPEHLIVTCVSIKAMCDQFNEPPDVIVDKLTGMLWDEEEAGEIKRLIVESLVELMFESDPEKTAEFFGGCNDNK